MEDNRNLLKEEFDALIKEGQLLLYSLAKEYGRITQNDLQTLENKKINLPVFEEGYDGWYSTALRVIQQILPERANDFISQYKQEKRREIDFETYTISDSLIGLQTGRIGFDTVDGAAAIPKMQRQIAILRSVEKVFDSAIADLTQVLSADLFDSELDGAAELAKHGFYRGGGAIAGVILEKHLAHLCALHKVTIRKKRPAINDFGQALKDANAIDLVSWRFLQHLADLRNLCDHSKDREPTKEDVLELVEGVKKVLRTINY